MKPLIIEEKAHLPKIVLDKSYGMFELSGKCIPKNPDDFFFPIFDWIDEYVKAPNDFTNVNVHIEYMNTASHKCFAIIIAKLDQITESEEHSIKITWHYDSADDDMLEMGEELQECNNIPFEFVPHKFKSRR